MTILVGSVVLSERTMEICIEFKKIFDRARQDQRGKLFAAFAAIAAHLVTPQVSISSALAAVGHKEPPAELSSFFCDNNLIEDAKTALEALAIMDNTDPDSWGSFIEFSREQYG